MATIRSTVSSQVGSWPLDAMRSCTETSRRWNTRLLARSPTKPEPCLISAL